MKAQAILTFDLEFWYNSKFLQKYLTSSQEVDDNTEKVINHLLDILKKHNQQAAFFVLGELANKYPDAIKKIADQGHEIASHGYSHKTLGQLSQLEFEKELKDSQTILGGIINKPIIGFRAPNFSLTGWTLKILGNNGFKYDASLHPLKHKMLGDLKEIKTSLGGIYFRLLPLWLYCWLTRMNKKPVLYFHPHELFNFVPQIKTGPWLKRKIKYWGTKSAEKKFIKLMKKFNFISIEQSLYENTTN